MNYSPVTVSGAVSEMPGIWSSEARRRAGERSLRWLNRDVIANPEAHSKLRRIRVAKGVGQQTLAKTSGVAWSTIREIESGRTKPHRRTIYKLARALDVEAADIS